MSKFVSSLSIVLLMPSLIASSKTASAAPSTTPSFLIVFAAVKSIRVALRTAVCSATPSPSSFARARIDVFVAVPSSCCSSGLIIVPSILIPRAAIPAYLSAAFWLSGPSSWIADVYNLLYVPAALVATVAAFDPKFEAMEPAFPSFAPTPAAVSPMAICIVPPKITSWAVYGLSPWVFTSGLSCSNAFTTSSTFAWFLTWYPPSRVTTPITWSPSRSTRKLPTSA